MNVFQVEPLQSVFIQEIEPLLRESWLTVESDYPQSQLNPNFGFYLAAQENGTLRVFTSRKEGVLAGYALVYLLRHPHRVDDVIASIETFFIAPKMRSHGHASEFLDHIEGELRMLGAVSLTLTSRNAKYERWLAMRGYHAAERIYERSLRWAQH